MRKLFVLAAIALIGSCSSTNSPTPAPTPVDPRIEQGAKSYATYCALCHGTNGEGYKADNANALSNQEFLAIAGNAFLFASTARGRPGTPMSAWSKAANGPLDDAQMDALVVFLRSKQTVPAIDLAKVKVGAGAVPRGQAAYNVECATCHGTEGQGGTYMSIANPEFLATANDAFLRTSIVRGRPGTPMPGFSGTLTEQAIDDIVVLIRSWAKPPGTLPTELPSKDLGNPVINPTGPDAAFTVGGNRYVPVAQVKTEFDRGAKMIILDARPPADYVGGHIAGAVSVPFYLTKDYLPQLSKDVWIIAYCACPHAESGAAADTLVANGYTKVKVIDEGLPLWKEKGYPMTTGVKP